MLMLLMMMMMIRVVVVGRWVPSVALSRCGAAGRGLDAVFCDAA